MPGAARPWQYRDLDDVLVRGVMDGFDLDQYLYRSSSPINFAIDITDDYGPVDISGHPVAGNALFNRTGRLTLRVFDVDDDYDGTDFAPEQDQVAVNGEVLPGFLTGADSQWSTSTFAVPLNLLKLPTAGNPNGTNDFEVRVDTANSSNVWAVQVEWAELRLETDQPASQPLFLVHGIQANADGSNGMQDMRDYFEDEYPVLEGRVISPTALGSIEERITSLSPSVDELFSETGATRLNIVAHSMGGLVARRYAFEHPDRVGSVYMMGTPNGGSFAADLACAEFNGLFLSGFQNGVVPPNILDLLPCRPGVDLFENTRDYVQDTFNVVFPDNLFVRYVALAGSIDPPGPIVEPPNDGIISVKEAEWLWSDDPDHPGLHEVRPHYDLGHDDLTNPPGPGPDILCELYPEAGTCPGASSSRAAATSLTTGSSDVMVLNKAIEIGPGAQVSVPLAFEGSPQAQILVHTPNPESISAVFSGQILGSADWFGAPTLGLHVSAPSDASILVSNSGSSPAFAQVVVLIESTRQLTVTPAASFARLNSPVPVTVQVDGSVPGDNPEVWLVAADDSRVAVPVTAMGSGSWSGTVTPDAAGVYRIVAGVGGATPRSGTALLTVSGNRATIEAGFVENLRMRPDGLAESLILSPSITATAAGQYYVTGTLVDSTGAVVARAGADAAVSPGSQTVDLEFKGRSIYSSGRPGPYRLVDVVIAKTTDYLAVEDRRADLGLTAAYNVSQFDHFRVEFDRNAFSDAGVDSNGDGLIEELRVTGEARVDSSAPYAINAQLVAPDGTRITESAQVVPLAAGVNQFALSFDGAAIGASGKNGPYVVADLSMYRTDSSDAVGHLVSAHTTGAYTSGQFRDEVAPVSSAGALNSQYSTATVPVPFTASDDRSGVAEVELWSRYRATASDPWGPWTLGPTGISSPINFSFGADGFYEFYTIAVDAAGNREQPPASADTATEKVSAATWSAPVVVNDVLTNFQLNPSVALGPDGAAYAAWEDRRNGGDHDIYFSRRNPTTGAWSANERVNNVTTQTQDEPAIAVDAAGNAYVVWTDTRNGATDHDIYFSKRSASTGAWSPSVRVNDDGAGKRQDFPSIAVSPSGDAVAVWRDQRGGGNKKNIYSARLPTGSSTWSANLKVTTESNAHKEGPHLAIGSDATAYAVWPDQRNSGNQDIWFASLASGASAWSANTQISESPNGGKEAPAIGVDTAGNLVAVWDSGSIKARRRPAGTSTWDPVVTVGGSNVNLPSISVRGDGQAFAAWFEGTPSTLTTLHAAEYLPGTGIWSSPELLSDPGTEAGTPSVAVDSSQVIILYHGQAGAGSYNIYAIRKAL